MAGRDVPTRALGATDPRVLGRYAIAGILGEGGMGRVYLGHDPAGRRVAIKVIKMEYALEGEYLERFREEAANAQRVARFYTAQVLDFNASAENPYLVTEFVEGPTLVERVRAHGPMEGSELDQLAVVMAGALQAVHRAGLVHRDLKPENVILSPTGPRLIDFGVARALDAGAGINRGMTVIGTPGYMAPEQILGQETTQMADVFAWGATIAFAGTGSHPFGEGSYHERTRRTLHEQPDLGRMELPLRSIVGRALLKDPTDRPAVQILLDMLTSVGRRGVGPNGTTPYASDSAPTRSAEAFEIEQEILRRMGL